MAWIWIVVGAGAAALVLVIGIRAALRRFMRRLRSSLEQRIAAEFPPDRVLRKDTGALTLGLQSLGVRQGRGNGALVLTPDMLWFSRAAMRRDTAIPLASITEVKIVRSHLGKTYFRDLLHVTFAANGGTDSMAWLVRDLAGWISAIDAQRRLARPSPEVSLSLSR